ncbi:MAG: hypothetical protein MUP11_11130, partial [Anaerolineales bacterium]|nr:hypothetical protein [Anaerolineales bacterium]
MQSLIDLLTDQIDIDQVPFSDRGSRLLIYQNSAENYLYLNLAERLVEYFSGLETYLTREAYLSELIFVNGKGEKLPYQITTKPHVLEFQTDLGEYKLIFQDLQTICFSLPRHTRCGLRLRMNAARCIKRADGGEIYSIRNLVYSSQ